MARIRIPVNQLPPTNSIGNHFIRFRISSEDRNSISEWSQCFVLFSEKQIPSASVQHAISINSSASPSVINLIWSGDYVEYHKDLDSQQHDIFANWSSYGYEYIGRVTGNNFSIISRDEEDTVLFKVQVPGYPIGTESEILTIFETEEISIVWYN